jgi:hypothetical protein
MTAEQFKNFRKSAEWRFLKQYLIDRVEGNRDLMELPVESMDRQDESDDFVRGRIAEGRLYIAAVENDELLLEDIFSAERNKPL